MKTLIQIIREYLALQVEQAREHERYNEAKKKLNAELLAVSPIKIGDQVKVTGYSHNGKQMIVEDLRLFNNWRGIGFIARGPLLKKDCTPGKNMGEHLVQVTS